MSQPLSHPLNQERMESLLAQLARFSLPGPGVTRLAYSEPWVQAHRWLREQAGLLGLESGVDGAGNLFLHPRGLAPGTPALWCGSHLDTVPSGGPLDGAYGVVAGLLLAADLAGSSRLPVVGLVTCEEEESRFRGGLMGARSAVGLLAPDELESLRDDDGVSWGQALSEMRACGCASNRPLPSAALFPASASLELHIEQGPVLERESVDLGVVRAIAGYRRIQVHIAGESRHAGTTPMEDRRDALAAGAECILAAESLALEWGPPAVATAGRADARPGLFNVVPGECDLRLELRHGEAKPLGQLEKELESRVRTLLRGRRLEGSWEVVSSQDPVPLSEHLAGVAGSICEVRGWSHREMVSGAGHDSMVYARTGIPTLMLFVPSQGGRSHCPDEWTEPGQLFRGLELAREVLRDLETPA